MTSPLCRRKFSRAKQLPYPSQEIGTPLGSTMTLLRDGLLKTDERNQPQNDVTVLPRNEAKTGGGLIMGFIDADAHVIETAQTWNFMLEEERRFAPELSVSARNGDTDYGHADHSNDIDAIQTLARGGKISASLAQKILVDNPRRLYGL
jgi:hypothetical protein